MRNESLKLPIQERKTKKSRRQESREIYEDELHPSLKDDPFFARESLKHLQLNKASHLKAPMYSRNPDEKGAKPLAKTVKKEEDEKQRQK